MNRRSITRLFLLFSLYGIFGLFGLKIHAVSGFATLVWIPSGLSLAFVLLWGRNLLPAVFFAAFLVNLCAGAPLIAAFCIAIGNTLEIAAAAYVLHKAKFHCELNRLKDVLLLFCFAAPVGSAIAASIGTTSLLLSRNIPIHAWYPTWGAWVVGDVISIIIITPFIVTWFSREPFHFLVWPRGLEALLLLFSTSFIGFLVFHGVLGGIFMNTPRTYLIFPPLIWASLRFGPRAAATNTSILSLAAITGILHGVGPFSNLPIERALLSLQIFMGVIAATAMILASVDAERKAYEARKDEFIALASHELKTPLTSLKILTQALPHLFEKRSQKIPIYAKKIDEHTERLDELITSLLDISKMQSNSLEFSKEYFSLLDSLKNTVTSMQKTTKHPISLRHGSVSSSLLIYGDKTRFEQVILNLLTNAMKYSPGTSRIVLRVEVEKKYALVSVKDFGGGIDPSQQEQIFERYYRVNEHKTYPGLGLGLYVARKIVRHHHGKLWVESRKGKGSTFYVKLPLDFLGK